MTDVTEITSFLDETKRLLERLDTSAIATAKNILIDAYHRKARIYLMGNGGSASTAQHFACDLAKYVIPEGGRPFDVRSAVRQPIHMIAPAVQCSRRTHTDGVGGLKIAD